MTVLLLASSVLAFVLNLLLTPFILKIAVRKDWVDNPNHRSLHKDPVPRLGGFGIFTAFFLSLMAVFAYDAFFGKVLPDSAKSFTAILTLLGLASTFVLGLVDDFYQFRAIYKFLLQLAGAFLAIGAGLVINDLSIPFTNIVIDLGPFGPFLSLLWILGITNAVNLIDGMDGLAGGFSVLAFGIMGLAMILSGHWFAAIACFLVVGSVLGFLVYNFPPAKIFMGDTGSLSLGYLLAVMALWGGPDDSLFHKFWLLPVTVVLIPVADTISAILRRMRQGVPIWSPDKQHTHHKLLQLGFTTKQILAVVYVTVAVTASPILLSYLWVPEDGLRDLLPLYSSLASVVLVIVLFWILHAAYRKRFPDPAPVSKDDPKNPGES